MEVARGGHRETRTLPLGKKSIPGADSAQNSIGTFTSACRTLFKRFFNIIEEGIDNDGHDEPETGTAEQFVEINDLIQSTKADVKKFLDHFQVDKVESLTKPECVRAIGMLRDKARAKK